MTLTNYSRYSITEDGFVFDNKAERMLRMTLSDHYYGVWLTDDDGVKKFIRVRTLIAKAFMGPRPSKRHIIASLDFDPSNHRLDNLVWRDRGVNMIMAKGNIDQRSHEGIKHNELVQEEYDGRRKVRAMFDGVVYNYDSVKDLVNDNRNPINTRMQLSRVVGREYKGWKFEYINQK
jgi:hypothetical protein